MLLIGITYLVNDMKILCSWAERVYEDDFVLLETKRLMATRLQAWFVYYYDCTFVFFFFNEFFLTDVIIGHADYPQNFLFDVSGSINKTMKSIVDSARLKSRPYAGCVLRREKQML